MKTGICFKHDLLKVKGICEACEKGEQPPVVDMSIVDPRDSVDCYWPDPAKEFLRQVRGY